MPNGIIKLNELNFLIENVSEQINRTNLFMFTKTVFQKNHLIFDKNFKIITLYMHLTKEYFILYYKNKNKKFLEFELFNSYLNNSANTLIIYNGYFLLFEKKDFYYYQKIDNNIKNDEIKNFVLKRFNFSVDNLLFINDNDLKKLKEKKDTPSNLNYLKKTIPIKFFYMILIVSCTTPFTYGIYTHQKNKISYEKRVTQLQNSINRKFLIKKDDYLYNKFAKLFISLKNKDIEVLSISYSKNKVNLLIETTIKSNMYIFFKSCKRLLVNYLNYNKKEKVYEANISFVF